MANQALLAAGPPMPQQGMAAGSPEMAGPGMGPQPGMGGSPVMELGTQMLQAFKDNPESEAPALVAVMSAAGELLKPMMQGGAGEAPPGAGGPGGPPGGAPQGPMPPPGM